MDTPNATSAPDRSEQAAPSTERQTAEVHRHDIAQDTIKLQTDVVLDHHQAARRSVENIGSPDPNPSGIDHGGSRAEQLHQQAQAGVKTLNRGGAGLPEAETSAMVAAAAAEAGLQRIDGIHLGTARNGERNLIAVEGDPQDAASRRAVVGDLEAIRTPMLDSLQRLQAATTEARNDSTLQTAMEQPQRTVGAR